MRLRTLVASLTGFIAGIAFVMACGENGPQVADASDGQVCDCPPAEPPLAGRIVVERYERVAEIAEGEESANAHRECSNPNAILLSGRCFAENTGGIVLRSSGASGNVWSCTWGTQPGPARRGLGISLNCLEPAGSD
jgi:hypothetical protein